MQLVPQLIPAGLLVTVPGPESDTETGYVGPPLEVKVAVTDIAALTVTVQLLPLPQLLPVQPWKEYPVPAVAVSVTWVPFAKVAEQAPGQLIPAGLLVTAPPFNCCITSSTRTHCPERPLLLRSGPTASGPQTVGIAPR